MLMLVYSDVGVFWMPLELVPKIPVNATREHHQGDRERAQGWSGAGGVGSSQGPQEGPDPTVCPRLAEAPPLLTGAPWCQGHSQNQAPDGHSSPG